MIYSSLNELAFKPFSQLVFTTNKVINESYNMNTKPIQLFLYPNKLQRPKSPTYTRIPIKIIRCEKKKRKKKENELNENPEASLRKDNEYSKYLLFAIFLFHFF